MIISFFSLFCKNFFFAHLPNWQPMFNVHRDRGDIVIINFYGQEQKQSQQRFRTFNSSVGKLYFW